MIKVRIDGHGTALNEENIDGHELAIRSAVNNADYMSSVDKIWTRIANFAGQWEEYPGEGFYEGYAGLVAAAAEACEARQDNAPISETEQIAQHLVDLKRAWVNVSNDPTEAGQESQSLYSVSSQLHEKLLEIHGLASASAVLNAIMPNAFTIRTSTSRVSTPATRMPRGKSVTSCRASPSPPGLGP